MNKNAWSLSSDVLVDAPEMEHQNKEGQHLLAFLFGVGYRVIRYLLAVLGCCVSVDDFICLRFEFQFAVKQMQQDNAEILADFYQ